MRRLALTVAVAAIAFMGATENSSAAFYRGHGDGIRVAFRVKGDRVTWANVLVRLNCKQRNGERHFKRNQRFYAVPDAPLRLDRRGNFQVASGDPYQGESMSLEYALAGHVGRDFVTGSYEFYLGITTPQRSVHCQTGPFPYRESKPVTFRAPRRPFAQ